MKNKPILCLDFDGVVHSYTSGWKGARNIPDPPVARIKCDASIDELRAIADFYEKAAKR